MSVTLNNLAISNSRDHLRRHPAAKMLRRIIRPAWFGTLRRLTPISDNWGSDRGRPVDRYYIERFIAEHSPDIVGRVLEVKDSAYTRRFGSAVTESHVIDIDSNNPHVTLVADLSRAENIAAESFDCFILTQTLQLIFDVKAAVSGAHRLLKNGGVLLSTVPTVSRIHRTGGVDSDFWRFTTASCAALFGEVFGPDQVQIHACGNVLTSVAFLEGLAVEELTTHELNAHDPNYPMLITIRAQRATTP